MFRNTHLGVPEQLRQRNAAGNLQQSRYYVYNDYRQLCKAIEPETGATVMDYDGVGNLIWSAAGHHDLPSTTICNKGEGYWWGRRVSRTYDARNRLSSLAFPDGRGNQSWGYTRDGLPASINTYNEPGNAGHVVNAYTYNNRRMLVGESVAQPGWYSWGIGYAYDANASLSAQGHPTGLVVHYAPNALGQATQAGSYATGVQYYPNGAIKQFTYGNGIAHTMVQNARQLPSHSMDSGGVLHHEYQYDQNANVNYIGDHIQGGGNGSYSRWMTYDNLDRLTSAGSCSFGGDCWHRFTYDALENLTSWKLGGVKDYATYSYETGTNRLGLIQNSAGAGIVGFGYDAQGNLANKNGQIYTFDFGNRLRSVDGKRWYRYDGLGRRIINWPMTGAHGDLSQYSQDGKVIHLADYTDAYPAGGVSKDHIYLGGSLVSIVEYRHSDGAQTTKYQHTDALGSPVAVTNQVGTVIDRTNWEPYGAAIGKPNYDGVGYTGHVMDGSTGLTYMQQRYYDSQIGMFLSLDPITANSGTGANFNRYWYANNNPYKFTDPDGRQACAGPLCENYRKISRHCEMTCMEVGSGSQVKVSERSAPVSDTTVPRRGSPRGYADGRFSESGKYRTKLENGKLLPRPHKGVDWIGPEGSTVRPMMPGKVIFSGEKDGFGNTVIVRGISSDGTSYDMLYAHMNSIGVEESQSVGYNTALGTVGQDGWASGIPHLHIEVTAGEWGARAARSDPTQWIENSPYTILDLSKP